MKVNEKETEARDDLREFTIASLNEDDVMEISPINGPPTLDVNLLQKYGVSLEDFNNAQNNVLDVFEGNYEIE